jgi:fimbrial chaperone protein
VLSQVIRFLTVALIVSFAGFGSRARADLMINPTRIVFDNNKRSAQLDVINDGTTPATYRLSIVNRRMTDSGEFQPITTPGLGDQFAGPMLVFSPRQITLQPGGQQLVRIALRKPADLPPGEYRSHLNLEKLADPTLSNTIESQMAPGSKEVGVTIAALIGVSIPVIVRQGQTEAQVTLSDIVLEKSAGAGKPPVIALQLNRSGNSSIYGDLAATFKNASGNEQVVAQAGGVAVYTPNLLRRVRLTLQIPAGTVLTAGTLHVTFKQRTDDGGKLIAENAIQIP